MIYEKLGEYQQEIFDFVLSFDEKMTDNIWSKVQNKELDFIAMYKFYANTNFSFIAKREEKIYGLALAQSVWQGNKEILFVKNILTTQEAYNGLLKALFKTAYDVGIYEIIWPESDFLIDDILGEIKNLRFNKRILGGIDIE